MQTKKVPVIAGTGTNRRVIGEAVVDLDENGFGITAVITDERYRNLLSLDVDGLSIKTSLDWRGEEKCGDSC